MAEDLAKKRRLTWTWGVLLFVAAAVNVFNPGLPLSLKLIWIPIVIVVIIRLRSELAKLRRKENEEEPNVGT